MTARLKNNAYEGYHRFADEDGNEHGSFEVCWFAGERFSDDDCWADSDGEPLPRGWYWCAGFPGCLPDGDPMGPFTSSRAAYRDAREAD